MKIIQVHNYYQQAGGEDAVVAAEASLLRDCGHEVVTYYKRNDDIAASCNKLVALGHLLKTSLQTIWNWDTYSEFRKMLRSEKPDVVHCHNTFPLISPSIYWGSAREGIPVVQTLHNYRLLCLNAFLFRNGSRTSKVQNNEGVQVGKEDASGSPCSTCDDLNDGSKGAICELCVKKSFKYPGIRYRCYRGSLPGSFVVALMLFVHRLLGTWSKKVTAYIALTEFQKRKMVEEGLPEDKIWVKPNFLQRTEAGGQTTANVGQMSDVSARQSDSDKLSSDLRSLISGQTPVALFVGRLSPEKGCDVLIRAWARYCQMTAGREQMSDASMPSSANNQKPTLMIVGDGPERESLESLSLSFMPSASYPVPQNIRFLGKLPKTEVLTLMRTAQFLILPSLWYEGFPMTIVESFSCGTPVMASNDGGMRDVIEDGETGYLFPRGNADALAEKMKMAFGDGERLSLMGELALRRYEIDFSSRPNILLLEEIYKEVRGLL